MTEEQRQRVSDMHTAIVVINIVENSSPNIDSIGRKSIWNSSTTRELYMQNNTTAPQNKKRKRIKALFGSVKTKKWPDPVNCLVLDVQKLTFRKPRLIPKRRGEQGSHLRQSEIQTTLRYIGSYLRTHIPSKTIYRSGKVFSSLFLNERRIASP